jgi:hypothetical protein
MNSTRLLVLSIALLISACSGEHFIEGTVVDYETGEPIEGATVSANQTGWDFSNLPSVVWDHTYVFDGLSNEQGKFHTIYNVGTSANMKAEKEGYVTYRHWYPQDSSAVIKLKPRDPNYVPPQQQWIEIGMKNSRPYGWVFAEKRTTFDEGEADLFPTVSTTQEYTKFDFTLAAPGGIAFVSEKEVGVESDWLVFADEAPADG